MGVSMRITLPPGTRAQDAANVLGIAAGLEWRMVPLGPGHEGSFWLRVPGATLENSVVREMLQIELRGPMVDGRELHWCTWHYQWEEGDQPGCVGLLTQSSPFWILVGCRLVETFGGAVDFDDCDDVDVNYASPPRARPASDGQAWQDYQDAMASTVPVSRAELEAFSRMWAEAS